MPTSSLPLALKAGMGLKQTALGGWGGLGDCRASGCPTQVCMHKPQAGVPGSGRWGVVVEPGWSGTTSLPGAVGDKASPEARGAGNRHQA